MPALSFASVLAVSQIYYNTSTVNNDWQKSYYKTLGRTFPEPFTHSFKVFSGTIPHYGLFRG